MISIVTITKNNYAGLKNTLNSLGGRDNIELEVIIVDANSDDGTAELIRTYSNLNIVHLCESDHGIYDAINKGVKLATKSWVLILNSGDELIIPDLKVLQSLLEDRSNEILGFDCLVNYNGRNFVRSANPALKQKSLPAHCAILARRELYRENLYDTELAYIADVVWIRKAIARYSYTYHSITLSRFNLGGVSNFFPSSNVFVKYINDQYKIGDFRGIVNSIIKFLIQRMMGKGKYLNFYVRKRSKH